MSHALIHRLLRFWLIKNLLAGGGHVAEQEEGPRHLGPPQALAIMDSFCSDVGEG
jgi:hypothetical protein